MVARRRNKNLYRGQDPVELPAYFLAEAAAYLHVPTSTVRNWVVGKTVKKGNRVERSKPFVTPADPTTNQLSFLNLVELHVVNSIRRFHGVQPKSLHRAIKYLEDRFETPHPLISHKMLTDGKSLFIERFSELANISEQGQLHMAKALEIYLKRIEYASNGIPIRLFPFTRKNIEASPAIVSINPLVRSGKPCIRVTGIPTRIIAQRYEAGDSISILMRDYQRGTEEIEEAIRYESGAAS